ncbi:Oidioi.mRNA.OKI2018_I69.XSR.g15228.t2.cds [Oikopleura dioica]|uniref:Phosphodiesterase n=1 Tax=Oikopleura dioica TaxID=34765 RepID=A0ABN7SG96_OIKDI|nr:Oidioi.mRNA.OKI2018_I69.XSR.g15228.t2.cds [Oikopleura dioica]
MILESSVHIPAELVEAARGPRGFTHRRTSLPAVLQPPSLITMSQRHFKEINEIIDDLLKLAPTFSQPVLLSIKKVKKIMRPYERNLEMATNDCQADSENSEVELESSWKTLTKRQDSRISANLRDFNEPSRTLPKRSRPNAGNSLERLVEKDSTSVFHSKLLPLSIRGSLGTSDYETDTTTAAEANFHDYISNNNQAQSKSTSYLLHSQTQNRPITSQGNFDSIKSNAQYKDMSSSPPPVTGLARSASRSHFEQLEQSRETRTSTTSSSHSSAEKSGASECDTALDEVLAHCFEWNFPIFELRALTHEVLSRLAYRFFDLAKLFSHYKLPREKFLAYFRALESGYRNCAYHNSVHAADVLQSVFYIINVPNKETGRCLKDQLDEKDVLSIFLAAAVHDYDHPGYTNNFLIQTRHSLAILYNDRSVLENHHVAAAWKLLISDPKLNFLANLDPTLSSTIRDNTIELVLSTDMAQHTYYLSQWKELFAHTSKIDLTDKHKKLLMLKMIIKFSDISNPSKEYKNHVEWSHRVTKEFYRQGDEEKAHKLPITRFMDRSDPDMIGNQRAFITNMVKPCYEALSLNNFIIDRHSIIGRQLEVNLRMWKQTVVDASGDTIYPDLEKIENQIEKELEPSEGAQLLVNIDPQSQMQTVEVLPAEPVERSLSASSCCGSILSLLRRNTGRNARYSSNN